MSPSRNAFRCCSIPSTSRDSRARIRSHLPGWTRPVSYATTTACARSRRSSLLRMRPTCVFTVCSASTSFSAISTFDIPPAISLSTSVSLGVRERSRSSFGRSRAGRAAKSAINVRVTDGASSASPPTLVARRLAEAARAVAGRGTRRFEGHDVLLVAPGGTGGGVRRVDLARCATACTWECHVVAEPSGVVRIAGRRSHGDDQPACPVRADRWAATR